MIKKKIIYHLDFECKIKSIEIRTLFLGVIVKKEFLNP